MHLEIEKNMEKGENAGSQNFCFSTILFNSLPNDKILNWSKLKDFADDKIIVNKN